MCPLLTNVTSRSLYTLLKSSFLCPATPPPSDLTLPSPTPSNGSNESVFLHVPYMFT